LEFAQLKTALAGNGVGHIKTSTSFRRRPESGGIIQTAFIVLLDSGLRRNDGMCAVNDE
jgi:hypothetical protein